MRHGKHASPVLHQSSVVVNPRGDETHLIRPVNLCELNKPTGESDVTDIALAMDESSLGKERGQKAEVQIGLRHLIHDPGRRVRHSREIRASACSRSRQCPATRRNLSRLTQRSDSVSALPSPPARRLKARRPMLTSPAPQISE